VGHDNQGFKTHGVKTRPISMLLQQALQGARHRTAAASAARLQPLLVVGGGGTLGSALLAEALVVGRFARVQALVAEPVTSTLRGLQPLPLATFEQGGPLGVDVAVIVFERQRHSNGRDDAFVQPAPQDLLPLAQALHARGVPRLIVVVPHAPALLPQALRHGLATLDEGAVAALGFEHLVFIRAAQDAMATHDGSLLQRFARWWLSQLRWMVPQAEQPVRAVALARCVVHLARRLPAAAPGTRVLAPELLWQAAQNEAGLPAAVAAWLGATSPP
jgi:hypothetical protein